MAGIFRRLALEAVVRMETGQLPLLVQPFGFQQGFGQGQFVEKVIEINQLWQHQQGGFLLRLLLHVPHQLDQFQQACFRFGSVGQA